MLGSLSASRVAEVAPGNSGTQNGVKMLPLILTATASRAGRDRRKEEKQRKETCTAKQNLKNLPAQQKALGGSPSVVAPFLQWITDTAASTSTTQGKGIIHDTLHMSVFLFCCKRELIMTDKQCSPNRGHFHGFERLLPPGVGSP